MSCCIIEGAQQFFAANFLLWTYAHDFAYKSAYRVIDSDGEFM